jgi:hypothetical protein
MQSLRLTRQGAATRLADARTATARPTSMTVARLARQ